MVTVCFILLLLFTPILFALVTKLGAFFLIAFFAQKAQQRHFFQYNNYARLKRRALIKCATSPGESWLRDRKILPFPVTNQISGFSGSGK